VCPATLQSQRSFCGTTGHLLHRLRDRDCQGPWPVASQRPRNLSAVPGEDSRGPIRSTAQGSSAGGRADTAPAGRASREHPPPRTTSLTPSRQMRK
jgi:hypothetical protein